jgi:sporulation protein YlmC with PRC-barrel domain
MSIQTTTDENRPDVSVASLLDTGGARVVGGTQSGGPGPNVLAANSLIGESIINTHGETLGSLADIMLDLESGRIAYAVMTVGGVLGLGNRLFAIPWTALTLDADSRHFLVDIAKERIADAPGFDKNHWPAMADYQWAENVHFYYKARPYWLGSD